MPRKPRKVPAKPKVTQPEWRNIVFADLHTSAKTLDRAIATLQYIRWLAKSMECPVICLGDFWDKRGILNVRQVHRVMDELDIWEEEGILLTKITGNHDQVNFEGDIHSLRIFDKYPNIRVIPNVNLTGDHDKKICFIPWHEDKEIQREAFRDVPAGYTVFGHGEAPGATANNGHKMDGRFDMPKNPRAVYLGHFHKPQQLGNVFYIGSPFEQNFGERGYEHGVALVQSNQIEPIYYPIPEMPKHWVLECSQGSADDVAAKAAMFELPKPQDIVQVNIDKVLWEDPRIISLVQSIKAEDVRLLPVGDEGSQEVPSFALSVDGAVDEYVSQYGGELDHPHLISIGKELLAQLPDTDRIVPLSANVKIQAAMIRGFCRIRDEQVINLEDQGNVLLQGRMRSGKTSLCDAITWCLFGTTTPRKAGSTTGSLRADDVVNDEAKECCVEVTIADDCDTVWTVQRTRKRSSSSKIKLLCNGSVWAEQGVLDVQDQIHRIIGMDYDLWRTCVYLGQGAVANFVTDADKARKALLSRAFGLSMCPEALKLVRKSMKSVSDQVAPIQQEITYQTGQLETLQRVDYQGEITRWEHDRNNRIASSQSRIDTHQNTLADYQTHLEKKGPWEQEKVRVQQEITGFTDQLTKSDVSVRQNQIHTQHGSLRTEHDMLNRELERLRADYRQLQAGPGVCPTCGQTLPLENREDHIGEIEEKIQAKEAELQTFVVRLSNLQTELGQLATEGSTEAEGIRQQIEEARTKLEAANQALSAIQQIEGLYQSVSADMQKAAQEIAENQQMVNPFLERAAQQQQEISQHQELIANRTQALEEIHAQVQYLEFWETGFSAKGLPVLVLRMALQELEMHANIFLGQLLRGTLLVQLEMTGDDLIIKFLETAKMETKERTYSQLSGGQRRCVEMAFVPFALSEMIFNRIGVRNPLLIIDELTTHMDAETKPLVCGILQNLNRETILVIDHDQEVQGEFDAVITMKEGVLNQ